jgi:hypothetical protein
MNRVYFCLFWGAKSSQAATGITGLLWLALQDDSWTLPETAGVTPLSVLGLATAADEGSDCPRLGGTHEHRARSIHRYTSRDS